MPLSNDKQDRFAEEKSVFVPLPHTERGFGIHISGAFVKGVPKIAYCNKNNVIIRNCNDPADNIVFTSHREKVNVAKFSPNGEQIASGDSKGKVIVWSPSNFFEKNEVIACREVLDIDQTGDNQRVVAAGDGGCGKFGKAFPQNSTNSIGEVINISKKALSVAFKPNRPFRMVVTSEEFSSTFYQGPPFKFKNTRSDHSNYPNCVRYNSKGTVYATVGSDKKIIFYDGLEGTKIHEIDSSCPDQHKGSILSCSWNKEGTKLLTASADKTVKIWDYETKKVDVTFTFDKNDISNMQVACLQLGDLLISVSLSGCINFLDIDNPTTPKQIQNGHQAKINQLSLQNPTSKIYSCDLNGRICCQDTETGLSQIFKGKGHSNKNIIATVLTADGNKLFSAGQDNRICLSNTSEYQFDDEHCQELKSQPNCIAARAEDETNTFLVGTAKGMLYICIDGELQEPIDLGYVPKCMAISKDNTQLLIGGNDKFAHLYKLENDNKDFFDLKNETAKLSGHKSEIISVAFSDDGKFITTTDRDASLFIWNNDESSDNYDKNYKKPYNSSGQKYHSSRVTATTWNYENKFLLSCGADENIILWLEVLNQRPLPLKKIMHHAHKGGVYSIHSLGTKSFVSMGDDRCIRFWNF